MLASTAHFWDTPRPRLYDDECTILNRTSSESSAEGSQELPLERLRARRRALLEELRDVDTQIRLLEDKTDQPPQRERVAEHVREVLEEQLRASASDLVKAVLRRDQRLHAGTVRAYISSLRRDGRLRAVGGRGVPGDPLVLALPIEGVAGPAETAAASAPKEVARPLVEDTVQTVQALGAK